MKPSLPLSSSFGGTVSPVVPSERAETSGVASQFVASALVRSRRIAAGFLGKHRGVACGDGGNGSGGVERPIVPGDENALRGDTKVGLEGGRSPCHGRTMGLHGLFGQVLARAAMRDHQRTVDQRPRLRRRRANAERERASENATRHGSSRASRKQTAPVASGEPCRVPSF